MARGFERPPLWAVIVMTVGALAFGLLLWLNPHRSAPSASASVVTGTPATTTAPLPVAAFLGDSYTQGVGDPDQEGYALRVASAKGWAAKVFGEASTGYTAAGKQAGYGPYGSRVAQVVAVKPRIVIVQGSSNDAGPSSGQGHIRDAAAKVYADLRAALPGAQIVVVGPTSPPSIDAGQVARDRDEVRAAASAAGLRFIDPIAENWLPSGDFYGADQLHPTAAGYAKYAARLVADLARQ